ncbi:MAG: hypothetical protein A2V59_08450 [Armatimonadetes bacterium RBG_19FT_COMBO_69_19]|nr:MAG: hypothetical protein A2V59_08450 [Armatimonadetes bacterium RBG_19FT_COMBO_69_19]
MFRRVFVPLDGSRLAESALPAAVELARHLGARVTVFHALERSAPATVHGERHLTAEGEARAYLAEVASWVAQRGITVEAQLETEVLDAAASIASKAGGEGADLVVLCRHGGGGLRGLIFGRVAQQVLQRGHIPVLLLQPTPAGRDQAFACHRIMVPLDGSATAEVALPAASALSGACGAELLLILVVPTIETVSGERGAAARLMPTAAAVVLESEAADGKAYLESLAARTGGAGRPEVTVERGEPVRVLLEAAASRGIDLIVMATHGRSGVGAVWAGSVAARVIGHSTRPVLLVRIPDRPSPA